MTVLHFIKKNLAKILFPDYTRIDTNQVKQVITKHGKFYFTESLRSYYNVFEQVDEYDISDIRSDDVVIDIGANVGVFTSLVAPKVSNVVAVEPLFFNELANNIYLNELSNVVILPYALGGIAKSGEVGKLEFDGTVKEVLYEKFSSLLKTASIIASVKPTFMKIDCEGGEWSLKPSDFYGIRAVEAEVHTFGGHNPEDYVEMLQKIGFTVKYTWTMDGMIMLHARR